MWGQWPGKRKGKLGLERVRKRSDFRYTLNAKSREFFDKLNMESEK